MNVQIFINVYSRESKKKRKIADIYMKGENPEKVSSIRISYVRRSKKDT